jgi:two-component system chemotaxis response regulator CheB
MKTLRVLIVDDSAVNREMIAKLLSELEGVEVVGMASDGEEALGQAAALRPDMITLDLEMPRMDGFTFLRLLMASRPTPVIVISSYAAKENVFRALELGAIDFIAKPRETQSDGIEILDEQLQRMVKIVRQLSPFQAGTDRRIRVPSVAEIDKAPARPAAAGEAATAVAAPDRVVVIAASTGGPTALIEIFSRLPAAASAAVVVAQHMPERFTKTFAERLDRISSFHVREAEDGQRLVAGSGLICPGGRSVEVAAGGGGLVARVVKASPTDRYTPSADRLFASAAEAAGERVVAVVLTGMGDDGAGGAAAVNEAGGTVLAEAETTAVVFGMPRAAQKTGRVDMSLPLRELAEHLTEIIS